MRRGELNSNDRNKLDRNPRNSAGKARTNHVYRDNRNKKSRGNAFRTRSCNYSCSKGRNSRRENLRGQIETNQREAG